MNVKLLSFLFLCAIVFGSGLSAYAASLGVSPGTRTMSNLLPGTQYPTHVVFTREDASETQTLDITVEGEAAEYVIAPERLVLPAGEHQVPLNFTIDTSALDTGMYETAIIGRQRVEASDGEGGTAATRVAAGAQAMVRFEVTNRELAEYEITQADIQSTEEGRKVGFTYFMINTGNVDTRPDEVSIVIQDKHDEENRHEQIFSEQLIPIVKAFSERDVSMLTDIELVAGLYTANIVIRDDERVVFESGDLSFQVFPPGTLSQSGELTSFEVDKKEYRAGELVVFTGEFRNSGAVGTAASFIVDIEADGRRLDLLKADSIFVPSGRTATMEHAFRATQRGNYRATGYVQFDIHSTNRITREFIVGAVSVVLVGGILAGITALFALFLLWKRRRKETAPELSVSQ